MKNFRIIIVFLLCFILVGCGEEKPAGDAIPTLTGEHYKTINVNLNCNKCEADKEVVIQLFADGYKVNEEKHTLTSETGYEYVFEDLPVFKDNNKEIKYEVKIYENGNYRTIVEDENSYRKKDIDKWVQVQASDLEPDHTYVLVTDNWNYEASGSNPYKYLKGDVTVKSAFYEPEYNIINGKKSFYVLTEEPIPNTNWTLQEVPEDDPYYEEFSDYFFFIDEEGKKLTLTKYNRNGNYIFKYSGKDGYIESEDAYYNNKVSLEPIDNSKGRFYIGSRVTTSNTMRYVSLSSNAQIIAQTNLNDAAQFLAFEKVQEEAIDGSEVFLTMDLCDDDNDPILDGYKHISVKFNCDDCDPLKDKPVTVQLFADGVATNRKKTLNKSTGYEYMFKNLPIFKEDEMTEVKYDVKVLNDDTYTAIPRSTTTNNKTTIKKWVQVLPENIEAGHTYVLVTDNWNYQNNNFSRKVFLRGDVTAKGAQYDLDYNVINGKKSYYSLVEDPVENTAWTVSAVPSDDPNYETFRTYLMFTNEEGKRLVLTGYDRDSSINFMYKASSKDGFIEDENAEYTNKVKLYPIEGTKGRFRIGTMNLFEEPNNMTQYVSLDFNNQYRATSEIDNAAQFMAFEYVDVEVSNVREVVITSQLCERNGSIEFTNLDKITLAPLKDTLIELHDSDNDELVATGTTNSEGKVLFNNLRLGRYYIVEKDIQTGYILSTDPVSFEIDEEEPVAEPVIKNRQIVGSVVVTDLDDKDNKPLKDALIEVHNATTDELIKSLRTGQDGKITVDELKYGTYYVIQKEPPTDYEINNTRFDFAIDTDGKVAQITIKNIKIEKEEPVPEPDPTPTPVPITGASASTYIIVIAISLLVVAGTFAIVSKTRVKDEE